MTYYIYVLENTRAQLLVSQTTTTDPAAFEMLVDHYNALGYRVNTQVEE